MQATIKGFKVVYDDYGCGPALVLIHGKNSTRSICSSLAEKLSGDGYRVVVPDVLSDSEDVESQSTAVVRLMNYLGIGKAVMIGLQDGEMVVADLVRHHSRRVAGVWDFAAEWDKFISVSVDECSAVVLKKEEEMKAKLHAYLKRFAAGKRVPTTLCHVA